MYINKLKNTSLPFWIFHISIVFIAVLFFFISPRKINTDFMAVIPVSGSDKEMLQAENKFMAYQNNTVNFIVEADDFELAKSVADRLKYSFDDTGLFSSSLGESLDFDMDYFTDYIASNVYAFLDKDTQDKILLNTDDFVENRLASAFSAFSFSGMDDVRRDPFMLGSLVLMKVLNMASKLSNMETRDGYLTAALDGKTYIVLSGTLNESFSLSGNGGADVQSIFEVADRINGDFDCEDGKSEKCSDNSEEVGESEKSSDKSGISTEKPKNTETLGKNRKAHVYLSGTPLHSAESSTNARREILLISSVSVALVLLLFFLVFRNLSLLVPFVISLSLSIITAASALFIFFKEIHIITLIFGTSLIGTCIDYSVHYYVSFAKNLHDSSFCQEPIADVNPAEETHAVSALDKALLSEAPRSGKIFGEAPQAEAAQSEEALASLARDKILRSLTIGFLSTFACYLLLLFSSYSVLKQIAAFCAFGLLSSYITTVCFFNRIVNNTMVSNRAPIFKIRLPMLKFNALPVLFALVCIVFAVMLPKIKIHNDVSSLYTPSNELLEGEKTFSRVMGYEDVSYALVRGETAEEALEREYQFTQKISNNASVMATTVFYPPISEQKKSIEVAKSLASYTAEVCEILGLDSETSRDVEKSILNAEPTLNIPEMLDSLNLGKVGENYYFVTILRDVNDNSLVSKAAEETDGVYYIQTAKDISSSLNNLTQKILLLFSVGFAIIVGVLLAAYGMKKGSSIALAPLTVIMGTVVVCTLIGEGIDFFFMVAMVLVMGLGLDYIVFMAGGSRTSGEGTVGGADGSGKESAAGGAGTSRLNGVSSGSEISVILSFLTTELSFGVLALSSFKPVKIFGLTIFVGITLAYLCAFIAGRKTNEEE